MNSYKTHRPYAVVYNGRTKQWNKMVAEVNEVDKHLTPLKKNAICSKLHELFEKYQHLFSEYAKNMGSGSNRFNDQEIESAVYQAYLQYQEDVAIVAEEKDRKTKEILEQESRAKSLQEVSLRGAQQHSGSRKGKEKEVPLDKPIEEGESSGAVVSMEDPSSVVEAPIATENDSKEMLKQSLSEYKSEHASISDTLQQLNKGIQQLHEDNLTVIKLLSGHKD